MQFGPAAEKAGRRDEFGLWMDQIKEILVFVHESMMSLYLGFFLFWGRIE